MGAGAVWVILIAMVLDINALYISTLHLNTYLLMVTYNYRVDMTCLFPEHLLQF